MTISGSVKVRAGKLLGPSQGLQSAQGPLASVGTSPPLILTYPPVEAIPANAAPIAKSTMIAANIANDPRDCTACGDLLTYR